MPLNSLPQELIDEIITQLRYCHPRLTVGAVYDLRNASQKPTAIKVSSFITKLKSRAVLFCIASRSGGRLAIELPTG